MEEEPTHQGTVRCRESLDHTEATCIDFLQREISRLLMKNETLRFELIAVRRKIEWIERIVFGPGSRSLQKQLPLHLLRNLRDLCCFRAENRPPAQADTGNVLTFRNK